MDFKLLGSVLLIVGTSIGGGMLALPIATAQLGFLGTLGMLIVCWFVMTMGAFLVLEVNLWLGQNSNLISMAKATTGRVGQFIAWAVYILLLYSLLCAYISGGSDLFQHVLASQGLALPRSLAAISFTLLFGGVVYLGIRAVDYVNRGLMFIKLLAYVLLITALLPLVSATHLEAGQFLAGATSSMAWMVTMTSFGFATIVPSLRIYYAGNVPKLRQAIILGSLVPLFCYIAWVFVIMGIIPLSGDHSLTSILHSSNSTSDLVTILSTGAGSTSVSLLTSIFTSVCVLTSFLGVALCLTDFLADGLHLEKVGHWSVAISVLTFLPPLVIVLFWPHIFLQALAHAGFYCVILLIVLPAWMALAGRRRFAKPGSYTVWGGALLPLFLLVFSLFLTLVLGFGR
jgi:tyrosine-specific transport protein